MAANVRLPLELDRLIRCIDDTFPLRARHRALLPDSIAELSRLLTSERPLRDGGYLGRPQYRAAYLRYFLPWNVLKLCALFSRIEAENTGCFTEPAAPVIADLGSGPLTVPLALWITFPALRAKPLTVYCVDRNLKALNDGLKLFTAFTSGPPADGGGGGKWKVTVIKADAGFFPPSRLREKAGLVTAVNLYNEMTSGLPHGDVAALEQFARKTARTLAAFAGVKSSIFVGEPGIPAAGQLISLLRAAFLEQGRHPVSPCPHEGACPMQGGKKGAKWCHIVLDKTNGMSAVPAALYGLSKKAGLTKTRLTASFIAFRGLPPSKKAPPGRAAAPKTFRLRVLSMPIVLANGKSGVYACSELGLTLLCAAFPAAGKAAGRRPQTAAQAPAAGTAAQVPAAGTAAKPPAAGKAAKPPAAQAGAQTRLPSFGTLLEYPLPSKREYDKKSGALLVRYKH